MVLFLRMFGKFLEPLHFLLELFNLLVTFCKLLLVLASEISHGLVAMDCLMRQQLDNVQRFRKLGLHGYICGMISTFWVVC